MRSSLTALLITFASAQAGPGLSAQATVDRVSGVVSDSVGKGVESATIVVIDVAGLRQVQQSDSVGHFVFGQVPRGRAAVTVRRLGFHPVSRIIDVGGTEARDSLSFTLLTVAVTLSGVDITENSSGAPAEFYERREKNHFGRFIDRIVLDKTSSESVSNALRGIAGVSVLPSNHIGNLVRIRGCRPTVWMNGMRVKGAEVDEVTVTSDVAAIEVYNSRAGLPVQYVDRDNPCGAILLWSRS